MPYTVDQLNKKKNLFAKRINVLPDKNYFFNIRETELSIGEKICLFQFIVPNTILQMICVNIGSSNESTIYLFDETNNKYLYRCKGVTNSEISLPLQKTNTYSGFIKNETSGIISATGFINFLVKS